MNLHELHVVQKLKNNQNVSINELNNTVKYIINNRFIPDEIGHPILNIDTTEIIPLQRIISAINNMLMSNTKDDTLHDQLRKNSILLLSKMLNIIHDWMIGLVKEMTKSEEAAQFLKPQYRNTPIWNLDTICLQNRGLETAPEDINEARKHISELIDNLHENYKKMKTYK